MANPFTKPSIDFNTYERANPADEQLNWGQIATDITKTFTDIEDNRAKRKAAIEKSYREQQEKIAELNNKYDTRTLQQWVNSGVMSTGEQLASQYNLLKRGLVTEAEFSLTQNNVSAGFKSIKSYADAYNKRMNEFTERRKTKMKNGEPISSAEEAYDVERLLMFNNLNNKKLVADRMGNLSVLTFDENGKPIEGESATVQQLEGLLYQETNNIDVTKVLKDMNKQLGTLSMDFAGQTKSGYRDLTETERVAADFRFLEALGDTDSERHQEAVGLLDSLVEQMVYDKAVAATYAVNNGVKTKDGDLIKLGTQDEFNKFAKDNPGKENPIIVRDYNKNSGMVQSFTTDDQLKSVKNWARGTLLGSFNASVKTKAERVSNVNIGLTKNLNKDKEEVIDTSTLEKLQSHQSEYDAIKDLANSNMSKRQIRELQEERARKLEEKINSTLSTSDNTYKVEIDIYGRDYPITLEVYNSKEDTYDPVLTVSDIDGFLDNFYFTESLDNEEAEDRKKKEQQELNRKRQNKKVNDDGL